MQTINVVTKVLGVYVIVGKERLTIIVQDAVHGETSWQTSHTTKCRIKGLLHVVVIVVLKHLEHSHPCLPLVVHLCLSAKSEHLVVLVHVIHHVSDGKFF